MRRRRGWYCRACGSFIGSVKPGAKGGDVLVVAPSTWQAHRPGDQDGFDQVQCRQCGEWFTWDGEDIRFPAAA